VTGVDPGIVSGTSAAMRSFDEFEETTYPSSKNAGSTSLATPEGRRREEEVHVGVRDSRGRRLRDLHLGDVVRDGCVHAPLGGLAVGLARAVRAGGDRGEVKGRVVVEQLDEPLSHGAGGAKDADSY